MSDDFEARLRDSALDSVPPGMARAVTHVLDAGGKRMRPGLVFRFAALCGAGGARVMEYALAVEMLHAATLVHDDIIDAAETRRGVATVHAAFGTDVALLVGDLLVARCGVHSAATGWAGAAGELFGALSAMVGGELAQRERRFDLTQGVDDYLETVRRKTSTLLQAACAGACMVALDAAADSPLPAQARQYGDHLGRAFQVIDDVLDYSASSGTIGKPVGNDLREGTVTLPLILALEQDPGLAADVERVRAGAAGEIDSVLERVRATGALERCVEVAEEEARRAAAALAHFPDRPERHELEQFALSLPHRSA